MQIYSNKVFENPIEIVDVRGDLEAGIRRVEELRKKYFAPGSSTFFALNILLISEATCLLNITLYIPSVNIQHSIYCVLVLLSFKNILMPSFPFRQATLFYRFLSLSSAVSPQNWKYINELAAFEASSISQATQTVQHTVI